MIPGRQTEPTESCEKVIVTGFMAALPVPHRPCIDDRVVEIGIVVRTLGGRSCSVRGASRVAFAGYRAACASVETELVLGGIVDEVFRVDCAAEVIVEIASFGHIAQESKRQSGLIANAFEIAISAFLGRTTLHLRKRNNTVQKNEKRQKIKTDSAHHVLTKEVKRHCTFSIYSLVVENRIPADVVYVRPEVGVW